MKCLPEWALGSSTSLPSPQGRAGSSVHPPQIFQSTHLPWPLCNLNSLSCNWGKVPERQIAQLLLQITYTLHKSSYKNKSVLQPDCNKNIHPVSKYLFCVREERPDLSVLIINIVFHRQFCWSYKIEDSERFYKAKVFFSPSELIKIERKEHKENWKETKGSVQ